MKHFIIIVCLLLIKSEAVGQSIRYYDDALKLSLDKDVGYHNSGMAYLEDDKDIMFYILYKHEVIKYEFNSRYEVIRKSRISLNREGSNGVGDLDLEGLTVINSNHFLLYSYWGKMLIHLDSLGSVIDRNELRRDGENYPVLRTSNSQPIVVTNKGYYIGSHLYKTMAPDILLPPIGFYDKWNDTLVFVGQYPYKTFEGSWGVSNISYIDKLNTEDILISSSISDSLHVIRGNKIERFLARSKYVDPPNPISPSYDYDIGSDRDKFHRHTLNGQYYLVKYDRWRKLIYRFVILNRTLEDFGRMIEPVFSLIVLNSNFEVLGEFLLPKGLYPKDSFINREGFFLLDKNKYNKVSDEFLSFTLLEICD